MPSIQLRRPALWLASCQTRVKAALTVKPVCSHLERWRSAESPLRMCHQQGGLRLLAQAAYLFVICMCFLLVHRFIGG